MKGYSSRRYAGIPLGLFIRRDIGKIKTFRVNRGNGYAGTKKGELIQLQYDYNVSDPNCDHTGIENKNDFADAVASWQALPAETKKLWTTKAQRLRLHMSGYNLYISKYRLDAL